MSAFPVDRDKNLLYSNSNYDLAKHIPSNPVVGHSHAELVDFAAHLSLISLSTTSARVPSPLQQLYHYYNVASKFWDDITSWSCKSWFGLHCWTLHMINQQWTCMVVKRKGALFWHIIVDALVEFSTFISHALYSVNLEDILFNRQVNPWNWGGMVVDLVTVKTALWGSTAALSSFYEWITYMWSANHAKICVLRSSIWAHLKHCAATHRCVWKSSTDGLCIRTHPIYPYTLIDCSLVSARPPCKGELFLVWSPGSRPVKRYTICQSAPSFSSLGDEVLRRK